MVRGMTVALLFITFATALISGMFGMGGGMILMGVLLALLPLSQAMVLHGSVQLTSNGSRAWLLRRHIRWRRHITPQQRRHQKISQHMPRRFNRLIRIPRPITCTRRTLRPTRQAFPMHRHQHTRTLRLNAKARLKRMYQWQRDKM